LVHDLCDRQASSTRPATSKHLILPDHCAGSGCECRSSRVPINSRRLAQQVRKVKNVVQRFDWVPGLVLVGIEGAQVLLRPVEVQASYGLSVVVISENSEIAQRISWGDALYVDLRTDYRLNDLEALELLCGGLDAVLRAELFFRKLRLRRLC